MMPMLRINRVRARVRGKGKKRKTKKVNKRSLRRRQQLYLLKTSTLMIWKLYGPRMARRKLMK